MNDFGMVASHALAVQPVKNQHLTLRSLKVTGTLNRGRGRVTSCCTIRASC